MTKWAFIDYENTGSLKGLDLSGYERVFVFCGPHNHHVQLDPKWSGELSLIKLNSKGKNNLDFHLTFHLGCHHEAADPAIGFDVVSNDCDFNGIVSHVKKLGRVCRKIGTKPQSQPVPKKPVKDLSETALLVIRFLDRSELKNWPRTKPKSLNSMKSHLRISHPDLDPAPVFAELLAADLVQEIGARLVWNAGKIRLAAGPRLVTAA